MSHIQVKRLVSCNIKSLYKFVPQDKVCFKVSLISGYNNDVGLGADIKGIKALFDGTTLYFLFRSGQFAVRVVREEEIIYGIFRYG